MIKSDLKSNKTIEVLMSTHNGEKYLREQIASIFSQTAQGVYLTIRDDGSTDETLNLLKQYDSDESVRLIIGNNIGAANSFINLILNSGNHDYYAFCDQDDVWDEDKIEVALEFLSMYEKTPSLYFSSTRVVDEKLNPIMTYKKSSPACDHAFNLQEVILGNNATGCTMVFNRKLRDIINSICPNSLLMHDHWVYAVCIAVGGAVFYDDQPHIRYRQHQTNVIGATIPIMKRIQYSSIGKNYRIRSALAGQILEYFDNQISSESRSVLANFSDYPNNLLLRVKLIIYGMKFIKNYTRKVIFAIEVAFKLF